MTVFCTACGEEMTGKSLSWLKIQTEIIESGGHVDDYGLCQDCIEFSLQAEFNDDCNRILYPSPDSPEVSFAQLGPNQHEPVKFTELFDRQLEEINGL